MAGHAVRLSLSFAEGSDAVSVALVGSEAPQDAAEPAQPAAAVGSADGEARSLAAVGAAQQGALCKCVCFATLPGGSQPTSSALRSPPCNPVASAPGVSSRAGARGGGFCSGRGRRRRRAGGWASCRACSCRGGAPGSGGRDGWCLCQPGPHCYADSGSAAPLRCRSLLPRPAPKPAALKRACRQRSWRWQPWRRRLWRRCWRRQRPALRQSRSRRKRLTRRCGASPIKARVLCASAAAARGRRHPQQ